MKKLLGLAALALAVAAPAVQAQAADSGNWLVRVRALNLDPDNEDNTGLKLSINSKTFAEFDISYFFSPNIAAELVLTYPQKHDLRADGAKIGTLKHLPPTLMGQYHVTSLGALRPYVGVGLNYTNFSSVKIDPAVTAALSPSIERDSVGLALQVGADYTLGGGWLVNFDLKKVKIETDVYSFGAKAGTFKVDPTLLSVGVGKRF